MNCKTLIKIMVLGILTGMPGIVLGKGKKDSLILQRIYAFKESHPISPDSVKDNVYAKYRFNVERRNPTLWLIPTMYVMAKGEREYMRESYNLLYYDNYDHHKIDIKSQVLSGTIRHNRSAMPTLRDLMIPNVYDATLYDGHVLSPFNRYNRRHYKYTQKQLPDGTTRLDFRPKFYNTQLINGYAIVDTESGHIIRTVMNGEFDMISFRTEIYQSNKEWPLPTPRRCTTAATFRFFGNRVSTVIDGYFNCDKALSDTLGRISDREWMDSLRVVPLSETDKRIYAEYDLKRQQPDTVEVDTTPKKTNLLKKIFWDTIGENLVTPISAESEHASFRLSPLLDPLQLSWSDTRGFRYKINLRSRYTFSPHRYLTFNPRFGYNFKFREFYFTLPLRMTYNPKRNGYAEIVYGNGNRISNSQVAETINHEHGDSLNLDEIDIDKFTDYELRVFNNIMVFDWLDFEAGLTIHRRVALNKDFMRQYGMPTEYRSFAPKIGLKIRPWTVGPLISIDWERGLSGVYDSDIKYERWEFDGSWKLSLPGLRVVNMRAGAGFYSHKNQNYFVDYANFRDNNLPEGWEDDWSGNFELLRSRVYNESNYYLRANLSYDSPMMIGSWVPYLGKYIERERFYFSTAIVERSRPYCELGYSFTNRYVSFAVFAGFNGRKYKEVGFDFDIELFRRW